MSNEPMSNEPMSNEPMSNEPMSNEPMSNKAMSKDPNCRRQSARSPLFMMIKTDDGLAPLWAWDVSLGGMQCRTTSMRFPGTMFTITFRLPGTDDEMRVGAQVTSLDALPAKSYSLGLRFCIVSPKLKMALYRFLDGRRTLWDEDAQPVPESRRYPEAEGNPFEALLLEAFATLRAKEMRRPGFRHRGPSADLERLSRILGNRRNRRAAVDQAA